MQFAAIVVYRLDRISRNIGDFAKLIEDLGERQIDFISIREQFDTSSPMGRAMMYIASVFSQLERETIGLFLFMVAISVQQDPRQILQRLCRCQTAS